MASKNDDDDVDLSTYRNTSPLRNRLTPVRRSNTSIDMKQIQNQSFVAQLNTKMNSMIKLVDDKTLERQSFIFGRLISSLYALNRKIERHEWYWDDAFNTLWYCSQNTLYEIQVIDKSYMQVHSFMFDDQDIRILSIVHVNRCNNTIELHAIRNNESSFYAQIQLSRLKDLSRIINQTHVIQNDTPSQDFNTNTTVIPVLSLNIWRTDNVIVQRESHYFSFYPNFKSQSFQSEKIIYAVYPSIPSDSHIDGFKKYGKKYYEPTSLLEKKYAIRFNHALDDHIRVVTKKICHVSHLSCFFHLYVTHDVEKNLEHYVFQCYDTMCKTQYVWDVHDMIRSKIDAHETNVHPNVKPELRVRYMAIQSFIVNAVDMEIYLLVNWNAYDVGVIVFPFHKYTQDKTLSRFERWAPQKTRSSQDNQFLYMLGQPKLLDISFLDNLHEMINVRDLIGTIDMDYDYERAQLLIYPMFKSLGSNQPYRQHKYTENIVMGLIKIDMLTLGSVILPHYFTIDQAYDFWCQRVDSTHWMVTQIRRHPSFISRTQSSFSPTKSMTFEKNTIFELLSCGAKDFSALQRLATVYRTLLGYDAFSFLNHLSSGVYNHHVSEFIDKIIWDAKTAFVHDLDMVFDCFLTSQATQRVYYFNKSFIMRHVPEMSNSDRVHWLDTHVCVHYPLLWDQIEHYIYTNAFVIDNVYFGTNQMFETKYNPLPFKHITSIMILYLVCEWLNMDRARCLLRQLLVNQSQIYNQNQLDPQVIHVFSKWMQIYPFEFIKPLLTFYFNFIDNMEIRVDMLTQLFDLDDVDRAWLDHIINVYHDENQYFTNESWVNMLNTSYYKFKSTKQLSMIREELNVLSVSDLRSSPHIGRLAFTLDACLATMMPHDSSLVKCESPHLFQPYLNKNLYMLDPMIIKWLFEHNHLSVMNSRLRQVLKKSLNLTGIPHAFSYNNDEYSVDFFQVSQLGLVSNYTNQHDHIENTVIAPLWILINGSNYVYKIIQAVASEISEKHLILPVDTPDVIWRWLMFVYTGVWILIDDVESRRLTQRDLDFLQIVQAFECEFTLPIHDA